MSADLTDRAESAIRDLYWKPWDAPGCEHVRVSLSAGSGERTDAVVTDGLVLLYRDGRALRCHYRYESRSSGFSADLAVDSGGFVVDYPDSFRRIW